MIYVIQHEFNGSTETTYYKNRESALKAFDDTKYTDGMLHLYKAPDEYSFKQGIRLRIYMKPLCDE